VAPYILERSANAVANKDGSAVLTVRANSFAWVARWVMGYGKEARILKPNETIKVLIKITSEA